MDYDEGKADEMVLALLYLTSFNEHGFVRAWKGHESRIRWSWIVTAIFMIVIFPVYPGMMIKAPDFSAPVRAAAELGPEPG